jgi:uncharacterized protein YbaR (Trm112 family)
MSGQPAAPSPLLLELLACPRCGGALEAHGDDRLACDACAAAYPVRAGVAVLLVEEGARVSAGG